jgi:hypothetical protein
LPSILDAAATKTRDPYRAVQQPVPSGPSALMSDPGALVARALAILSEETAAWHERRAANPSRGSTR